MINISTVQKTSNIITIKGVSFTGISSKKTKMVPIEFSDNEPVINNCSSAQYANYKNGAASAEWSKGVNTIDREIDIATPYSNGAKYIYVLSSAFYSRSQGLVSSGTGSMAAISKDGSIYTGYTTAPTLLKKHLPADEEVAHNNSFDACIMELLYPIELLTSQGATGAVFSYVAEEGVHVISTARPYSFENSVINKPIAYFVYEE